VPTLLQAYGLSTERDAASKSVRDDEDDAIQRPFERKPGSFANSAERISRDGMGHDMIKTAMSKTNEPRFSSWMVQMLAAGSVPPTARNRNDVGASKPAINVLSPGNEQGGFDQRGALPLRTNRRTSRRGKFFFFFFLHRR